MTINLTRRTAGALLAATALPARADTTAPDPIYAVIGAARVAMAELSAAVRAMDDADPASVEAAYSASHRCGKARDALSRTQPASLAGVRALVQFHADDVGREPDGDGARALRDVAKALDALSRPRASPG